MDRLLRVGCVVALIFLGTSCDFFFERDEFELIPLDPRVESIFQPAGRLELLAEGFGLLEGPVWHPAGYVLFSDMAQHIVFRWAPELGVMHELVQPGWQATRPRGPNGLALDGDGHLVICQHGRRTLVRRDSDGTLVVLADRFDGHSLNSPNDLVIRSDGYLFFTDPPFGLAGGHDDPRRELNFSGVFGIFEGKLKLVTRELMAPNGIALSPNEQYLYVSNSDPKAPVVMRYEINEGGTLVGGRVFHDFSELDVLDSLDGLKTDSQGNVFVASVRGILILSPIGQHIGTIRLPEQPNNMAWGDADRSALYITTLTKLYRLRMGTRG